MNYKNLVIIFCHPLVDRQDLYIPSIAHSPMECAKCKTKLEGNSKFCPNCGEKIEDQEKDTLELYHEASGCWFLIGMTYGSMKAKKDEEGIKEFEKSISGCGAYSQYKNALAFAENQLSQSKQNKKGIEHP